MKKLSICLLVLLLLFCGQAAFAAEDMSAELAKVTQSVKTTLNIGDEYKDFYGNQSSDRLFVSWELYWSNDDERINVTADSEGRIISYNRNSSNYRYTYSSEFAPIFPKQGREEAQKIAQAFLAAVLAENEEMIFDTSEKVMPQPVRADQTYYFYGSLKVNGLPSPFYVSIEVDMDNLRVSHFYREVMERQYIGGLPSSTPRISAAEATPKLDATISMKPAYYLDESGKNARLQYRPVSGSAYYVDALSGELIDMDELYRLAQEAADDYYGGMGGEGNGYSTAMSEKAMDMAAGGAPAPARLTEVEQAGIDTTAGLLDSKAIDAKLRAMKELGLESRYTLSRINYGRDGNKPVYFAYLNYYAEADAKSLGVSEADLKKLKENGNKYYIYKDISLNAQTGEIRNIYTSRPYLDASLVKAKEGDFSQQGKDFLAKYFNDYYKETALNEDTSYALQFERQANGYAFPENYLQVRLNPYTGVVEDFTLNWNEDITFASAEGLIGAEQAQQAYVATMECKLGYKQLPVAVDRSKPEFELYISSGVFYLYKMGLVYAYEPQADTAYGVDALTGEALFYQSYGRQLFDYDDIEGLPTQSQIEELARYGIGFAGGKFEPAAKLTELDMLLFFISAQGNSYDPAELPPEKIESIYQEAYYLGILEQGYKMQPQREISRSEYLKTIVRMSGYGKTALIPGIYNGDFADAAAIPAELYGYATIAQGLGLVPHGGNLNPAEIINRAEAALIFHSFMAREY